MGMVVATSLPYMRIVKGVGGAVAKEGGQLLLKPASANLTQKGLDHIVVRHWFTSGAW